MHKLLILIATLAIALSTQASRYAELPASLDGSMSLYDFAAVESPAIPDTLTPVRISYIARHGARYLTSESKVKSVEKALRNAQERGSLTRAGRECLQLMQSVREATAGQWGMLSPIGKEQELRLGREMAEDYPSVFVKTGAGVKGVSSYVPRVIETMDQFFISIADTIVGIPTSASSGKEFDPLTRFFSSVSEYADWRHSGDWHEVYDSFAAATLPVEPAKRLVGDKSGMTDAELRDLSYDLYKVLQGLRAMGLEPPTTQWMSADEYRRCWEATNMQKYFQYSLSPLSTVVPRGASAVLFHLLDVQNSLLSSADPQPGLEGIFGHAETLLPIFALLGVPGTTALPLDYSSLASEWSDAVLTPLAANLAIVYSRAPSGTYYASMRLNGRNVSPVNDPSKMQVSVAELQAYWLNRYLQLLPAGK